MAKRTPRLKLEIEPKPKRVRRPNPDIKFKLTQIGGQYVWKSLQGDTIVTLRLEDTQRYMEYRKSLDPSERARLIFEPWEED